MSLNNRHFEIKYVLDTLHKNIGDSEFGYRIQGLLAHVFLRLGGEIIEIKPQGHPDIIATLGTHKLLLQVKTIYSKIRRRNFVMDYHDLLGIKPTDHSTLGYLALLDCVVPTFWILVRYDKLRRLMGGATHVVTLRAMANKDLSSECTQEFADLVLKHQYHLRNLDFSILCSRALKGEAL